MYIIFIGFYYISNSINYLDLMLNIFNSVDKLNIEMMITFLKDFRVLCVKMLYMFVYMNYCQLILKSILGIFNSSLFNEHPEIFVKYF